MKFEERSLVKFTYESCDLKSYDGLDEVMLDTKIRQDFNNIRDAIHNHVLKAKILVNNMTEEDLYYFENFVCNYFFLPYEYVTITTYFVPRKLQKVIQIFEKMIESVDVNIITLEFFVHLKEYAYRDNLPF